MEQKKYLHIFKSPSSVDISSSDSSVDLYCSRCIKTHKVGRPCVGEKFQVEVPNILTDEERKEYESETIKDLQVWRPTNLPDADVEAYLKLACDKYNYSLDQAYALLYWSKQDLLEAEKNLEIFTPCPDSWNSYEKLAFEQGYQIYQKDLKEIKEMLPMKTLKEIVEYYYLWKKKGLRQLHFTVDDSDAEAEASKCSNRSKLQPNNRKEF